MLCLQESTARQAAILEEMQARAEEDKKKEEDKKARVARAACIKAIPKQLEASAARQVPQSRPRAGWGMRTMAAPLATAARWLWR